MKTIFKSYEEGRKYIINSKIKSKNGFMLSQIPRHKKGYFKLTKLK